MRVLSIISATLIAVLLYVSANAENRTLTIKGIVDPSLTKVKFHNSANIGPVLFENDHHATNKCYRVQNGYLTFISSQEGIFEGYELSRSKPIELTRTELKFIDTAVKNYAGIHIGIHRKDVQKIMKQDLTDDETELLYKSVKIIKGIPFDVMTYVIIRFENDQLVKFRVITYTTN